MPMSNFPNGFAEGVLVRGIPLAPVHGAKVFYVGNNSSLLVGEKSASNTNKGNYLDPFSTVTYALTQCVSNRGDIIFVRPGYTETLTGTGDTNININEVTIVGLGTGAKRPTITIGTANTATYTISGSGVALVNHLFVSALDGLDTALTVTGADCYLDIEHRDTSSLIEADIAVTATGARPYIKLKDIGFTAGDQRDASVSMNGVSNGRVDIDFYGKVTVAVVNFVTAACTDITVKGYMYVSGTTDGTKNVVDTISGSTWFMEVVDGSAGAKFSGGSAAAVASDDVSTINSKLGTITNTGGTATIGAVLGDFANTTLLSKLNVPTADATANVNVSDVMGNKTDAAVYIPGTNKSALAYLKGHANLQENVATTPAAVLANGTATIFTVAGGPIEVLELLSVCVTANDATATTLKYTADPTDGAATDLSIASASLANAAAGTTALCTGTFASAPTISANGTVAAGTTKFIVPAGVIQAITATGPTTGTWTHHLRYKPLAKGVTVS